MGEVVEITTTGPGPEMRDVARTLLEERRIACAQFTEIASMYHWEGEIQSEKEVRVTLHAPAKSVVDLSVRLEELHPYEVPVLFVVALGAVSKRYTQWVLAEATGPVVPSDHSARQTRPSNVKLSPTLTEAAQRYSKDHGVDQGSLILLSIEANQDELRSRLSQNTIGGRLFERRPVRPRPGADKAQETADYNYRMDGADFVRIDQLVMEYGAASREALIETALTIHLEAANYL